MAAREDIITAIDSFQHPNWTPELRQLTQDVMDALEKVRPGVYDRGRVDQWAAALVWSICATNWTTTSAWNETIPQEDICMIFDVSSDAVDKKSLRIGMPLRLSWFTPAFKSGTHIWLLNNLRREPQDWDPEFRELAISQPETFEVIIQSKKKFSRSLKLQAVDIVKREAVRLVKSYGPVELHEAIVDRDKKTVPCIIDAPLGAIFKMHDVLRTHGFNLASLAVVDDPDDSAEHRYAPSDHYIHFITRYESSPAHRGEMDTFAEAEEFVNRTAGMTTEEMQRRWPLNNRSKAWLTSLEAYEQPRRVSLRTIEKALNLDPDCLEAHLCRIGWMEDREKRIDALQDLLDRGDRVLGVNEEDFDPVRWWGDHTTRPYMRAMEYLGTELMAGKYLDEAKEIFEDMLDMNSTDNQGVRHILVELAIYQKDFSLFDRIRKTYPDDGEVINYYGEALIMYYRYGNKSKSKKAAERAFERNPYPILLITGEIEPPDTTGTYALGSGSVEEGMEVAYFLHALHDKDHKAVKWLVQTFVNAGYGVKEEDDGARVVKMW